MQIVKIAPTSKWNIERLLIYIMNNLAALEQHQFRFQQIRLNGSVILTCNMYPKHLSLKDVQDTFRHFISTALAEYIIEEIEKKLLFQLIKQVYSANSSIDLIRLHQMCQDMLFLKDGINERDEQKIIQRKSVIYNNAYKYLMEEQLFNLEGFLSFRTKEYMKNLMEIIVYANEEYILDREYQEFIFLLREYIARQEPKLPILHIFHRSEKSFVFYDETMELIKEEQISAYLDSLYSAPATYEDVIVSILIAISPKRIILHTQDGSYSIIRTIKNIFQDRLLVCSTCSYCHSWTEREQIKV